MSRRRLFILAILVVALGSTGFFAWRTHYHGTPQYALAQIERSVRDHDRFAFQTFVDLERLVPAIVDQVIGQALVETVTDAGADGWEALGAAVGGAMANQMKPAISTALRGAVLEAVETGRFDSIFAPTESDREIDLALFQETTGADAETFVGLTGVERRGDAARVGLRFEHPELDTTLVLHMRMERNGERWQVVAPDDLDRYLKVLQELRDARVAAANGEIGEEARQAVELGGWEREERRFARNRYLLLSREVRNASSRPIHHVSLELMSPVSDDELTLWAEEPMIQPGESALVSAAVVLDDVETFTQTLADAALDALPFELTLVRDTGADARYLASYPNWEAYVVRKNLEAPERLRHPTHPDSLPGTAAMVRDLTGWRVTESRDPLTDQPTVMLSIDARRGTNTYGSAPTLVLRCQRNTTEAYIAWREYLGSDGSKAVVERIGDAAARRQYWGMSTSNTATFYSGGDISFIKSLLEADRFVAQTTPYGDDPLTAVFELEGLSEKIGPLRRACHW